MVAYNLLLSVFPLALLALFIAGRVLESGDLEQSVLQDLRQLFPTATDDTLTNALDRVRNSSTELRGGRPGRERLDRLLVLGRAGHGVLPHLPRALPHLARAEALRARDARGGAAVHGGDGGRAGRSRACCVSSADDLPLGLSDVDGLVYAVTLVAGLVLLFLILCLIYWTVPNRRAAVARRSGPGRSERPSRSASWTTRFPFYLSSINTIARFGTTFVFVVIVLIWFYVLAIIILGGATINAMRFELHETGQLSTSS